jgi:Protein of unknown function (DUF4232)
LRKKLLTLNLIILLFATFLLVACSAETATVAPTPKLTPTPTPKQTINMVNEQLFPNPTPFPTFTPLPTLLPTADYCRKSDLEMSFGSFDEGGAPNLSFSFNIFFTNLSGSDCILAGFPTVLVEENGTLARFSYYQDSKPPYGTGNSLYPPIWGLKPGQTAWLFLAQWKCTTGADQNVVQNLKVILPATSEAYDFSWTYKCDLPRSLSYTAFLDAPTNWRQNLIKIEMPRW